MEDFSIYHIPSRDIDWHSIQPTFFQQKANREVNEGEVRYSMKESNEKSETSRTDSDSNKLVSAYAMFFKERQTYVKKSFPHAIFGDISRIVAAQWDALEKHEKMKYKKRTECLRKMQIKLAVKDRLQRICQNSAKPTTSNCSPEKPRKMVLVERQNSSSAICKNKK
ncbi:hypothetical protein V3C99_003610 [Haemonchus contortus]